MENIQESNEYFNIYSKNGEQSTYLPELQHPTLLIGAGSLHVDYLDMFEAVEAVMKVHAPEFCLFHLN